MPSYAPRKETIKKQEELSKREYELIQAILHSFPTEKICRITEKYRAAQLSLFKTQLHAIREMEFQKKPCSMNKGSIISKIEIWTNKTYKEIIESINHY